MTITVCRKCGYINPKSDYERRCYKCTSVLIVFQKG